MTAYFSALCYAGFAALPTAMQLAVAAGAPLGQITVGGRFESQLPPRWRLLAIVQALVLLAMSMVVLDHGGVINIGLPNAAFWAVFALTCLTFIANVITPSKAERLLWSPVIGLMLLSALGAHFLT